MASPKSDLDAAQVCLEDVIEKKMQLELGIDTINRVEVLSEIQGRKEAQDGRLADDSSGQGGSPPSGMGRQYVAWSIAKRGSNPKAQKRLLNTESPTHVVVRVLYCGLCGSDVHMSRGEWQAEFPMVLGHEIVGVVAAVPSGAGASLLRPGVAVGSIVGIGWQNQACGGKCCGPCQDERPYHCKDAGFTCYNNGGTGGFAGFVQASPDFVVLIPSTLLRGDRLPAVAPLMCGGLTVYHPLSESAGVGKTLLVVGFGGLGSMAVQFGCHMYDKVVVVSTSPSKAKKAIELGANMFYTWDDLPSSAMADIALVCASGKIDMVRLCQAMRPRGVIKMVGISPEILALDPAQVVNDEITVVGRNTGSPSMLEDTLYFAAKHNILPQVTLQHPQELAATLSELETKAPARRFVFRFGKESLCPTGAATQTPPVPAPYRVVEDPTVGKRLVSSKACAPGLTFAVFRRLPSREVTQHSMWDALLGQHYVARREEERLPFFLEHHPNPNLRVDPSSRCVVAMRVIQPGDFLTINYAATERQLYRQFPFCALDAPVVRPWASGASEALSLEAKRWLNVDTEPQDLLTSCHVTYQQGCMHFQGIDLAAVAKASDPDVPTFVYSKRALRLNLYRISYYLWKHFERSTLLFSVKSNSSIAVLCELRHAGMQNVDICSPQELERARQCGFAVERMQYTGTGLSDADLRRLGRHPLLKINCDSLSMLSRVPHTKHVGLRLDPDVGMSYQSDERLQCTCASKPTKMGIPLGDVSKACAIARKRGITLERLHVHVGNSYQTRDLAPFDGVLTQVERAVELCRTEGFNITEVNLGGGHGVPYLPEERTFDWDLWAQCVSKHPTLRSLRIMIEPGDSIVKNAGVLVTRVTDVVDKGDTRFVSLTAGMNLNQMPAYYGIASYPFPVFRRPGDLASVDVVGNLNESIDVWRTDVETTPIHAGDHVALLNCGGYAHSCRSMHSLRTEFVSVLL